MQSFDVINFGKLLDFQSLHLKTNILNAQFQDFGLSAEVFRFSAKAIKNFRFVFNIVMVKTSQKERLSIDPVLKSNSTFETEG